MHGFQLRWVWYVSMASVALQMVLSLMLLQREFRRRLVFAPRPDAQPALAPEAPATQPG